MKNLPYGYKISNGKVEIDEENAAKLKQIIAAYLSGMSFSAAAQKVGINKNSSSIKLMIQNPRYLGNDFYPPILTEDITRQIEEERLHRAEKLGRMHKRKGFRPMQVCTKFYFSKVQRIYENPIQQVEYAYSLIRSEVSE